MRRLIALLTTLLLTLSSIGFADPSSNGGGLVFTRSASMTTVDEPETGEDTSVKDVVHDIVKPKDRQPVDRDDAVRISREVHEFFGGKDSSGTK